VSPAYWNAFFQKRTEGFEWWVTEANSKSFVFLLELKLNDETIMALVQLTVLIMNPCDMKHSLTSSILKLSNCTSNYF
jgi:hypothetical protein